MLNSLEKSRIDLFKKQEEYNFNKKGSFIFCDVIRYNKMSEHGEKSQELETMMQQLKKGTLNSFDLESAKSIMNYFIFLKICKFKANNQKIKNCTEDALFYYKKHLVLLYLYLYSS